VFHQELIDKLYMRVKHYSQMAYFHVEKDLDLEFEQQMKIVFEDAGKILEMQDDTEVSVTGVKNAETKEAEAKDMQELVYVLKVLRSELIDQVRAPLTPPPLSPSSASPTFPIPGAGGRGTPKEDDRRRPRHHRPWRGCRWRKAHRRGGRSCRGGRS
jgi:hypothetical protein